MVDSIKLYPACDIFKEGLFQGRVAGKSGKYRDNAITLTFSTRPETEKEVDNELFTKNATVID